MKSGHNENDKNRTSCQNFDDVICVDSPPSKMKVNKGEKNRRTRSKVDTNRI